MKKGFTLVELLVVIAIIGVLAAAVLVSLAGTRPKARDARRRSDLQSVSKALQLYADANTTIEEGMPWAAANTAVSTTALANAQFTGTLAVLVPKYLQALPIDPSDAADIDEYGYTAIKTSGDALADTAATAIRFRLGAESEVTGVSYNIWNVGVNAPTGDILIIQ